MKKKDYVMPSLLAVTGLFYAFLAFRAGVTGNRFWFVVDVLFASCYLFCAMESIDRVKGRHRWRRKH